MWKSVDFSYLISHVPLIHQITHKGACFTHDRKKLVTSLSEKILKLISKKLQQFKTQYIVF